MNLRQLLVAGLLMAGAMISAAQAEIIYVDAANTSPGAGESWADAFDDLQDALGVAADGDEIRVAAGIYRPVVPDDPGNVSEAERGTSFELKDGVEVLGGFPPGGGTLGEREPENHVTVLSGDIDVNDSVDYDGVVTDPDDMTGDNSFRVVDASDTDETAILDGFWITAGLADESHPDSSGAGANARNSGIEFRHIVFIGNSAGDSGGGLVSGGNVRLSQVRFEANEAGGYGGGMLGDVDAEDVEFRNNHAVDSGGGMALSDDSTLLNVRFHGNTSSNTGGAVASPGGGDLDLVNAIFSGNHTDGDGGAVAIETSGVTLTNATFSGNRADGEGGAVHVSLDGGTPGTATLRNTIIWNNQASGSASSPSASIYLDTPEAETVVSYSLVDNCNPDGEWNEDCGTNGGNTLADADPLFVDPPDPADAPSVGGDLGLPDASPAIDAGNDVFIDPVEQDLNGNPRIMGGAVDLGPFEMIIFTVHVIVDPAGSGLASCHPNPVSPGEDSVCTRDAVPGYRFTGWSGDCSGEECAFVNVNGDQHVTAHFEVIETIFHDRFSEPPGE